MHHLIKVGTGGEQPLFGISSMHLGLTNGTIRDPPGIARAAFARRFTQRINLNRGVAVSSQVPFLFEIYHNLVPRASILLTLVSGNRTRLRSIITIFV